MLSIGEVTAATAQISVTGAPGSSFYLGVFTSSSISSFDKSELADVIISAFGEEVLDNVFTMPEDQTMGTVTFSGLTASTSFTAVLFGIDKETLDGDIAKAYFTTTGTATTSVKTKAHRSIRHNYVERPFERLVVLGAAVSNDIAMKAPAFDKVR